MPTQIPQRCISSYTVKDIIKTLYPIPFTQEYQQRSTKTLVLCIYYLCHTENLLTTLAQLEVSYDLHLTMEIPDKKEIMVEADTMYV